MNIKLIRANNGEEAINIIKKDPSINLVLMDLKLPVLDGFKATSEIKKIRKDIPVIAHTGYAQLSDKEKAIKAGCNDFLTMPIIKTDLKEIISKYSLEIIKMGFSFDDYCLLLLFLTNNIFRYLNL